LQILENSGKILLLPVLCTSIVVPAGCFILSQYFPRKLLSCCFIRKNKIELFKDIDEIKYNNRFP
jgi:hypothetical protein